MANNILYLLSNTINEMNEGMDIGGAVVMELFVTIHMSVFVLFPLAAIINKSKKNEIFAALFILRAIILIVCNFVFGFATALFDFFAVFFGAFILVPFLGGCKFAFTGGDETYSEQKDIMKYHDTDKLYMQIGGGRLLDTIMLSDTDVVTSYNEYGDVYLVYPTYILNLTGKNPYKRVAKLSKYVTFEAIKGDTVYLRTSNNKIISTKLLEN